MSNPLSALEARVAADLHAIRFPERDWVIPARHSSGAAVRDVVIIGGGQGGLSVAFALLRRRITNIQVVDAKPPGQQGPWRTYGRMLTLRSPKHVNGPDLDVPSLTCESYYRARYGDDAWEKLNKVPCGDWQDYLLWFRDVVGIAVQYETTVLAVEPDENNLLRLSIRGKDGVRSEYARKVVFATGVEGNGAWVVPQLVRDSLPGDRYSQVAGPIDFEALRGKRIGVLGGGASAYDNAAAALENGAGAAHVFFRRPALHRFNPHTWSEFAGFMDHFRDLPDEWRWRFMSRTLPTNEPPPPETFLRATQHPNFTLHLGESWERIELRGEEILVGTGKGEYVFDHLFVAVGMVQDTALQRELASMEPYIARWSDRYTPPSTEKNEGLGRFPYLGRHFEYTERAPGTAPSLANIYNFNSAATVSHGPSGSSVQGMKQSAQRIATGICRDLFTGSIAEYHAQYLAYDEPELAVPWPPVETVVG